MNTSMRGRVCPSPCVWNPRRVIFVLEAKGFRRVPTSYLKTPGGTEKAEDSFFFHVPINFIPIPSHTIIHRMLKTLNLEG